MAVYLQCKQLGLIELSWGVTSGAPVGLFNLPPLDFNPVTITSVNEDPDPIKRSGAVKSQKVLDYLGVRAVVLALCIVPSA